MRLLDRAALLTQRMGRQLTFGVMTLAMLLSYNALGTSAAFASVLQLIAGGTGTHAVTAYPTVTNDQHHAPSVVDASLNFTPRWPGYQSHQYFFKNMEVLSGQWWTNGAMVALHYEHDDALGSHPLTILEFLPQNGMVLQVVKDGSAQQVQVGDQSGVFVWGHWVRHNRQQVTWEPSQRAELIFGNAHAGEPVIWVVGNELGTMSATQMQTTLVGMSTALTPMKIGPEDQYMSSLGGVGTKLAQGVNQPFYNDIIALVPDRSNPDAPMLFVHFGPTDPNNS
jgi:hypothetical protein